MAVLSCSATGNGIFDTLALAHNALLDNESANTLIEGDLNWILFLAVQQIDSDNSDIAGRAARTIVDVARKLTNENLQTPAGAAIFRALEICGEHPDPSVRAAVAYGLGHLVHQSKSAELAELASRIVGTEGDPEARGLANDHSGIVRGYVRFGSRVGEVEASQRSKEPPT